MRGGASSLLCPALLGPLFPTPPCPWCGFPGAASGGPAGADLNSLADLQPDPADGLATWCSSCLRAAVDVLPDQRAYFRPGRARACGAADLGLAGRPPHGLVSPGLW